ncbi:MAG: serine hydrolase domain-containing protein [Pseudomonadales bacterium]
MSAGGLNAGQLARIEQHLASRYIDKGKLAGTLTAVWRRGELAYLKPQGQRDLASGAPMTEDTIFRIYSMSKPITSVALMMLYERGVFQLGDPVHRWIPEWAEQQVYVSGIYPHFQTRPVDRPMTVKDLLTHMSGLTYDFMAATNVDAAYRKVGLRLQGSGLTLDTFAERLAPLPLLFSPGSSWNYSFATDVCGLLVQRMSGLPLDQFLQQEIFGPLKMGDTGFSVPESERHRFASNYERAPDRSLRCIDEASTSPFCQPATFFSGGGGLLSTAHDYLRFCRMLLGGGTLEGARIIGPKTLALMGSNHLPDGGDLTAWAQGSFSETTYEGIGFGLGFAVNLGMAATSAVGTEGELFWGGAASTIFWVDPREDLACVFLTQLMPSGTYNFRGQLKAMVYGAIEP